MGNPKQGLIDKYRVERTDGSDRLGGKHEGCSYFVLDLTHDKHAAAAIYGYIESCRDEYPMLADDLEAIAPRIPFADAPPLPIAGSSSEPSK